MNYLMHGESSERLLFRKLTEADFDLWLPFHKDQRTSQFWSGLSENPIDACHVDFNRTFYRYEHNLGGKLALIEKKSNHFVGLCGLLVQEVDAKTELEIAYSLLPKYWHHGFATEAAQKCKIYAIANALADSLISIIHIDNRPSQKVALNMGMKIDKKTVYHTNPVYIYRISI